MKPSQEMKFSIKDFFIKCDQIHADLVTFTEEILHGKLHFLCSEISLSIVIYILFKDFAML